MSATVYLNGSFVEARDATVSVFDGGWLHGAGLFETMRAENGRVFRLEAHLERLRQSASTLLFAIERDALPTADVFEELLARNELKKARIRLTVTSGPVNTDGMDAAPALTVCATASTLSGYPKSFYEKGIPVVIGRFRVSPSDPAAGHKTTNFLPRLLALRDAQASKCAEALWLTTANRVAEGCISNVFVVSGGTLKTPPLDTPVLPGIARGVVLESARDEGIEALQCPLVIDDLLDADEVLLTNAIMQVLPVVRIEKRDIGKGEVGPMARRLLDHYRTRVRKECGGT